MPFARYGTFKTVTIFSEMAETVLEVCASEKVSVLAINPVQYFKQGGKVSLLIGPDTTFTRNGSVLANIAGYYIY